MRHPIIPFALPAALTAAALVRPSELQAQAPAGPRVSVAAAHMGVLSRERTARWVRSAPVIHCSPAPLTERPGTAGELARPHVAPLEAAFFDSVTVKRTLAARSRSSRR
jgi:hypothetical protein